VMNQNRGKFRRKEKKKMFELMIDGDVGKVIYVNITVYREIQADIWVLAIYYVCAYLSSEGIFVFLEELIDLPRFVSLLKLFGCES
jgi:hypothetical protein